MQNRNATENRHDKSRAASKFLYFAEIIFLTQRSSTQQLPARDSKETER